MKINILPTSTPIFSVYNWHSGLQSIILKHPDALPWIYSNYIQIYMNIRPEITFADFYLNNGLIHTTSCPFIHQNTISRNVIKQLTSFVHFFIECLKSGYYLYLFVDVSYISGYSRKNKGFHELFIYGFDVNQEIFIVSDYINGKYTNFTATFKEIEDAVESTVKENFNHLPDVEMWRLKENSKYDFDLQNVINELNEFKNSINSAQRCRNRTTLNPNLSFGLDVYDTVSKHLIQVQEFDRKIDIRPFHLFYERFKLMCDRIHYMDKKNYILDAENYFTIYKNFADKLQIARNLVIKHQITNEKSIIPKLQSIIELVKNEEGVVVEKMIKDISSFDDRIML